ncbi:DUF6282 family protein [Nitrospirillum sp. BR 11163]|uniref:DUF6282 family protein n=1 Tax=Nitrospirillum sp. BR 11163 TaxID=3104323 RepID=UPI002AFEE6DE|nr:DUF6282 family protein [Nitrospirillum sp. BR 11163]MEA1672754.1 DUF6282 family protein [Nitrospirillum sp. BR 11163]
MTDRRIDDLLVGAVDLHCHSGPSVMPRRLNHVEAIKDAEAAGLRAILFKDHYYSVTPVAELLKETMNPKIQLLTGVPLNNTTGGLNPYAVEHGFKLGARLVWMPTFSAANHIRHSHRRQFLPTKDQMLPPRALTVVDDRGALLDEVKVILDQIAQYDAILSAGHLHISEIWPLFAEAKTRGVKRLLVNHPTFLIGCGPADMKELAGMGAYLEHSCCMWAGVQGKNYTADSLNQVIKAGGVDSTIIGSDLGQVGNPTPVEGFRHVIGMCIELGYSDDDIRKMISLNASRLVGLDEPAREQSAAE